MKLESEDTTKFETMILSGDYSFKKGVKTYNVSGTIAFISGNGESTINLFKEVK